MVEGLSPPISAWIQILSISDDLQLLEERNDLLVAGAVVFDDLAGLTLLGRRDGDDLLARAGEADGAGVDAEVGDLDLVDRLGLRRHDPLERRVAGLDDASG